MKHYLALALLISSCTGLLAQDLTHVYGGLLGGDTTAAIFQLRLWRVDDSDALTRGFVQKFFLGGSISENEQAAILAQSGTQNRYASETVADFKMAIMSTKRPVGISVGYRIANYSGAEFSDALFDLAFNGNGSNPQEVRNLGDASYRSITLQSASLGLVWQPTGARIDAGLYHVLDYQTGSISNALLSSDYDTLDGSSYLDELQISSDDISYSQSQPGDQGLKRGVGIGINAYLPKKLGSHLVFFECSDLGAYVSDSYESWDSSGTFAYRGITYDFASPGNLEFFPTLEDSLVPNKRMETVVKPLPAFFALGYLSPKVASLMAELQLAYRSGVYFAPEASLAIYKKWDCSSAVWVRGSAGGLRGYAIGAGAELKLSQKTLISLGSDQLLGIVNQDERAWQIWLRYALVL